MNRIKALLLAMALTVAGSGVLLTSCSKESGDDSVLFVRVPADIFEQATQEQLDRYPGAQLVLMEPGKPGAKETILTPDFYSACSPFVSYDARRILFLAQRDERDSWQVWEMDLRKGSNRQVTDFEESCAGPAYLPGDRLVFSRQVRDMGSASAYALFTMNLDGTHLERITFHPHEDFVSAILNDGRILMLSSQLYPDKKDPSLVAIRPNGTKSILYYSGDEKSRPSGRAFETHEGRIIFIAHGKGAHKTGQLVSIDKNRPLFSQTVHSSSGEGRFYSVYPLASGKVLISYKPAQRTTAGLYTYSSGDRSLGESVIAYEDWSIVDPVLLKAYRRPRNLPDEVNPKESTGQLMCQNINITGVPPDSQSVYQGTATQVEVLGMDRSLGITTVEADGSFYLKIQADLPFRLQTLDGGGQVVNGPSGWLWLRPIERRGCVGCHEDPELAPENLVPLAVKKPPVIIPVEELPESSLGPAVRITD